MRPILLAATREPSAAKFTATNSSRIYAGAMGKGSQVDRLSNLPNDILLNIVDRLGIVDIARTSFLSKRWRQIPAMLSKIDIVVGSFKLGKDRSNATSDDVVRANSTTLEITRRMLENRPPSQYTIDLLSVQLFLGDDAISIGQTVANTMATQKVGSSEFTILTDKDGRKGCTYDDLVAYGRQLRSFVDACPVAFGGLTRLKLEHLTLAQPDFPEIFGICKRLEFLHLFNCDVEISSSLQVEHPQLSQLEIINCRFEGGVDLKWLPKLALLTFKGWLSQEDPFCVGHAPLLESVSISNIGLSYHKMLKLSEILGKATISDLHLNFRSEKIWVKPEGPKQLRQVFHSLKVVTLDHISEECDLAWTLFILQGAPFLKELCIQVWDNVREMIRDEEERKKHAFSEEKKDKGAEWEGLASDFKHHNLTVLRIYGFQAECKFFEFIRSVMEAAVDLEGIYLHNRVLCKTRNFMVPSSSKYPRTYKQKMSVRNKIYKGNCWMVGIHFPG
ncbi:uncharacterized protein LOC123401632 [Hordeum vulgare subsp. vulgare]|uniref:F-box domain-containing protein n=1 Tax=Hordeum vulgare subsp. vulgare TaxID=112509 RepID=A0A8I6YFH6_HORVV|nr:uncharacterized protein LOC123401632 [Hordeum vulgare subsp. vulgare]